MNAEQKQRAKDALANCQASDMAALLQELVEAPSVPDGWRKVVEQAEATLLSCMCSSARREGGCLERGESCCMPSVKNTVHALREMLAAPTPAEAPADVALWIDTNDKTQKQFLPHVGERVLFCYGGKTYYGKHTGGSFISFTNPGKTYPTWECHWMYPPAAIEQEQAA